MPVIIGLETHMQLPTKSKLFCGCKNPALLEEEPDQNTLTCPTCLGLPGSKPQLNAKAIEIGMRIALALGCTVASKFGFSRKTYFYPDMSKDYQITQYEVPLGSNGEVIINGKKIRIRRVHLEEDPAKLIHVGGLGGSHTLIDYNRSGIPLVEIVTEPDMDSPEEAREYLALLSQTLQFLDVYDPATKSVLKSDANISMPGGARVEVKNITGEKEVYEALRFEIIRQGNLARQGQTVQRETRMWTPDLRITQSLRAKETEEDYGYIAEPDLAPVSKSATQIEQSRKSLPELPAQKYARYQKEFGIPAKVAESLLSDPQAATLFEAVVKKADPKLAANWITGPVKKTLNYNNLRLDQTGINPVRFVKVLSLLQSGKLSDHNAEMLLRLLATEKGEPEALIKKHGLASGKLDLHSIIEKVLAENQKAAADFKENANEKALHFLTGLVMRETKGKADAKLIQQELRRRLD